MLKKKCKSIVLVVLCLFVFSIQIISAQSLPLQDTIIMVDAGHGGYLYTRCNKTSEKAL